MRVPLGEKQLYKHCYIRTFFLMSIENLESLYKQINTSLDLNPKKWQRFINSKELFGMVYPLMSTAPEFTLEAIAYSEPIEQLGVEMRTGDCEIYFAMPFELRDSIRVPDIHLGTLQHATGCFITMLGHMFFKHLYQKPFTILREVKGYGSVRVCLNDNLEYFIV